MLGVSLMIYIMARWTSRALRRSGTALGTSMIRAGSRTVGRMSTIKRRFGRTRSTSTLTRRLGVARSMSTGGIFSGSTRTITGVGF